MEMNAKIDCQARLGAVLIRCDGSRQDLGVISDSDKWMRRFAKRLRAFYLNLRQSLGHAAALALLLSLVHSGQLPWQAVPLLGLVTTAGVNYMASDFASGGVTPTISGFKFHDSGTGATAAAIGDTTLQTPTGNARVSGTPTNPSANLYRSVATLAYTGSAAITEWGLFSASTTGTLWDRRVFSAINVANGDSIQFTYTLTISAGGS